MHFEPQGGGDRLLDGQGGNNILTPPVPTYDSDPLYDLAAFSAGKNHSFPQKYVFLQIYYLDMP